MSRVRWFFTTPVGVGAVAAVAGAGILMRIGVFDSSSPGDWGLALVYGGFGLVAFVIVAVRVANWVNRE